MGQTIHYAPAPLYPGVTAYGKTSADVFSATNNIAAAASLHGITAGVYSERKFLLEWNEYLLAIAFPVASTQVSITSTYSGITGYTEGMAAVGLAKGLGKIDIGIQFIYHIVNVAGYGSDNAIGYSAGLSWHLSDQLCSGFTITNPVGGKFLKHNDEKLASVYRFGLGYEASPTVFAGIEVVQEEGSPFTLVASVEYNWAKKFFLRAGVETAIPSPYLGAGVSWKRIRLDVVSTYHPQLGVTPGLLIVFLAKKQE